VLASVKHALLTMIAVETRLKGLFAQIKNALALLKENHAFVGLALFTERMIFQEHTFVLMKEDTNMY